MHFLNKWTHISEVNEYSQNYTRNNKKLLGNYGHRMLKKCYVVTCAYLNPTFCKTGFSQHLSFSFPWRAVTPNWRNFVEFWVLYRWEESIENSIGFQIIYKVSYAHELTSQVWYWLLRDSALFCVEDKRVNTYRHMLKLISYACSKRNKYCICNSLPPSHQEAHPQKLQLYV
jgi:hypothetical protein